MSGLSLPDEGILDCSGTYVVVWKYMITVNKKIQNIRVRVQPNMSCGKSSFTPKCPKHGYIATTTLEGHRLGIALAQFQSNVFGSEKCLFLVQYLLRILLGFLP